MLSSFDGESRLALVAEALIKNQATWVKGRWKVTGKNTNDEAGGVCDGSPTRPAAPVPRSEAFRSPEYKQAVKSLAWHEFRGLSKSTIKAVLAESNYSYFDARRTLVDLVFEIMALHHIISLPPEEASHLRRGGEPPLGGVEIIRPRLHRAFLPDDGETPSWTRNCSRPSSSPSMSDLA